MDTTRAYENLEKAVSYGFLTSNFKIGSTNIVLKNVTDKEYRILDLLRSEKGGDIGLLYDLSFCTVFINNQNFLEDRYNKISSLMDFYSRLPGVFISKLQESVIDVNREYIDSLEYLEGFFYTDKSRHLWKFFDVNNRDKYWGVAGLCNVGMNTVQENWIAVNKNLDAEEVYARDFNLSLIVASAYNGKGAKSMSKSFEARQKELEELRCEIARYGYDKNREKEEKKVADGWSAPLRTREDLVKELYREMRGEKDKHDLFIEGWMQQQKDKADEAKKLAEDRQREFREKFESIGPEFIEGSRPVSAAEMKKVIEARKDKETGAVPYMTSVEGLDDKERFLKKISATVIRPNMKKE